MKHRPSARSIRNGGQTMSNQSTPSNEQSVSSDDGTKQTFVIVGCGAAKREKSRGKRWPAKDLYTSTYFGKKREYAETVGDQWMILSAKHGLVPPGENLRPYDTSINDLGERALDELAHEVGMELIEWVAWAQSNDVSPRLVVLAGRKYLDPLRQREAFSTAGVERGIQYPLQQNDLGGIGEQMAWLEDRVEASTQHQPTLSEVLG